MNSLIIFIACLLVYLGLYTIIDRVCKCLEYRAMVKAYAAFGGKINVEAAGVPNKAD